MSCLLPDPQDASEPQACCGHGQQRWLTNGQERERMKDSKRKRDGHDFPLSWRKSNDVWRWRCLWTCTDSNSNSVLCVLQLASSGINTHAQTFPNFSPLGKNIDWLHFVFPCSFMLACRCCVFVPRSRLADFHTNCQMTPHSISSCLNDDYQACLTSYTRLIGELNNVFHHSEYL